MTSREKKNPLGLYIAVSAAVIGLDQLFKWWVRNNIPLYPNPSEQIPLIPGVIHLSHIRNAGVAFGLLQGGRWAFLALLAVFCALVIWAIASGKLTAPWERWLGVLAMAGALGNGIDRALYGYVVDMFRTLFMEFAVFNVADICVVVGGIAAAAYYLFLYDKLEGNDHDTQADS